MLTCFLVVALALAIILMIHLDGERYMPISSEQQAALDAHAAMEQSRAISDELYTQAAINQQSFGQHQELLYPNLQIQTVITQGTLYLQSQEGQAWQQSAYSDWS